jgi:exonuclease III
LKLISWNLAGWVSKSGEQAKAIISRSPSIVCLQEVRRRAVEPITKNLFDAGYRFSYDSVFLAEQNNRVKGNMVVSKFPIEVLPQFLDVPYIESVISVTVKTPYGDIRIHNAHIPNGSSNGWKKIETFEAIFKALSSEADNPRILCGDFNSPQFELTNGETVTWGQSLLKKNEVILREKNIRWHQGEFSVIRGLAEHNLPDVFRQLHGYNNEESSYIVHRKGEIVSKRRFDHVFASQELKPQECVYLHEFREMGLSDHSPIEVLFSPNLK